MKCRVCKNKKAKYIFQNNKMCSECVCYVLSFKNNIVTL
jgi:hypothetical protein